MKKMTTGILAAVLALLLLCGCGANRRLSGSALDWLQLQGQTQADEMPPFDQIVYERPDVSGLQARVAELRLALESGKRYRTVTGLLDACYEDYYHFLTMNNLAYIRSCQDLTDAYYTREAAWCDEQFAAVAQTMEDMLYACGTSDLAQKLERQYFWEGFAAEYGDDSEAVYDGELLALLQEESVLVTHYRTLMANPTIQADGGEVDLYSHLAEADDEAYYEGLMQFYRKYNEELAGLYIELVQLRCRMAEKLGYDSYEQMAYDYSFQRDYSPEQAEAYLQDIRTWIVPLYRELTEEDYEIGDGGFLSTERLHRALESGAAAMGGSIEEAFRFMDDYDLYDIRVSAAKAADSFQVYLTDYEAPFLFLSAEGRLRDLINYSHEFGHYVDAYVNYDADETVDVSETFSQAMEYLMLGCLDAVLSEEEQEELYRIKMLDTLDLYAQQASFAEFEHIVYSTDPETLSVDFLNELFLRMTREYGYYDGYSEEYYAVSWTDISHFFEMPFYIIAYPVSNDIAMQIYELEQRRPGAGLEKYLEILPRAYSGLVNTVSAGGLESPFAPGRVEKVAEDLWQRLGLPAAAAA